MNIKDVSTLTGVSVRTLQHYDKIKLLSPKRNPQNDYREYTDEDLDLLQQILLFKACGFPLKEIKRMIYNPRFNRIKAYELQRKLLLHEKERIEKMLDTLDQSILSLEGDISMTNKDKFNGLDMTHNPYEDEARSLYGDEAVDKSNAFINSKTKLEQEEIARSMDQLFKDLAKLREYAPDSSVVQEAMASMYRFFNEHFGIHYSPEAFKGLGELYISDERFTKNIDRYGDGLAKFLSKAMSIYAKSLSE